ncbi:tetratricopeptide repeat protein [Acidovorax sp. MR-S7]|uniref:O-linked N-acetylglucosamine transferase, SPINDLY family protein n=1 Tax=Acidovorax sp. MR-S7 TaxID=1268622 RepID=UPI00036BBA60|nr:tetratricopeptide repeat protein [Acidovorax sp. MR-S7]GAD23013.1 predicted O-linked N-acetylglucosamine transferase, SPINDLY family [Acidovorax sp. MR-S7]
MTNNSKPYFGQNFGAARPGALSGFQYALRMPAAPQPAALPGDAQGCNAQGNQWMHAGRAADAVRAYDRAIALQPDYLDPHFNRGNALLGLQRNEEALASFEQAIVLSPRLALAHYNRGAVLEALGRAQDAADSYRTVLEIEPGHVQARFNLGCIHLALKQYAEALACMDEVIAYAPQVARAHSNRGVALLRIGRSREAIAACDQALALQPQCAETLNNRGTAYLQLKNHKQAYADLSESIRLKPEQAQTRQLMATLLKDYKQYGAMQQQLEKAYQLAPDLPLLLGELLHAKMLVSDWHRMQEGVARLGQAIVERRPAAMPFHVLGMLDSPGLHLQAARNLAESDYAAQPVLGPLPARAPGGKIRVGYYSADFHAHATAYLMAELFERHDRERFEWFAFSFGPDSQDPMRHRLQAGFDHFLDVRERSGEEIARLSRDLGIDIAVDLKGFTQDMRFEIFSFRCAPVQVSWLGYPGTTGADYMDYVIADKVVLPPEGQAYFTEKAVYLPHSYQVNDGQRRISGRVFTREEVGLPANGFVFCCFNNNYKILPPTFDGWMRILHAVEGSVLWLLEDNPAAAANLRREAQARGIAPERLVFAPRMELDEHLARHRLAGLFLDTLPYNAHTTASDALWAGLPVLTCRGQSFASRVAASLLHAVGLPELVTGTQADFEARAIALARDAAQLQGLRDKLHAHLPGAPLFDAALQARHIEAAYAAMHERALQGLPPEVIEV